MLKIYSTFVYNRMPFGGVTVKDVDAYEFVKAFAAHLNKYVFCVQTIAGTHIQTFVSNWWALIEMRS